MNLMRLKGQLHVHTTFSDGSLTPQEAADLYARLGFDFIAFSDHDHLLKPDYRQAVESVRTRLLVFFGIELTVHTRWGYVHVNRLEGENEVLHIFNHPADYKLSVKQILECIEDVTREYPIDAVEVTHLGFYTPMYDVEEIPYPKVASDDSHNALSCGRAWIELSGNLDKDEIIRKIKKGEFSCSYLRGNQAFVIG